MSWTASKYARDLRALSPPVGIYFETENINTLSQNGELLLTVLAAFAQGRERQQVHQRCLGYPTAIC